MKNNKLSILLRGIIAENPVLILILGIPYSPTLTSIHDYWKNQSLD